VYEIEIILDPASQLNIENVFNKHDVNIAFVYPISQSSFAPPSLSFGSYPFVRFESIQFDEPIYFAYEVCQKPEKYVHVYVLKPYMIYPVVETIDKIWNTIETLVQSEDEKKEVIYGENSNLA
jgi:hypothetical protein